MITLEEKYDNFVKYLQELFAKYPIIMAPIEETLDEYPWKDHQLCRLMLGRFLPPFALQIKNREIPIELSLVAPNCYCLLQEFLEPLTEEETDKIWLYLECFLYCLGY